jgi:hypothetical protein
MKTLIPVDDVFIKVKEKKENKEKQNQYNLFKTNVDLKWL